MAKAPTGVSIKRSGNTFTVSWKKGEKDGYSAQDLEYKIGDAKKWTNVNVTKGITSKALPAFPTSSYCPNTATTAAGIHVRIRGKKSKKWSKWSPAKAGKAFDFAIPDPPTVEANPSSEETNVCTFTWNVTVETETKKYFGDVEYQSMLLESSAVTDGSKLNWTSSQPGWRTGHSTSTTSFSVEVEETEAAISTGSHTRWFRVRSRGPAGESDWRYAKRVYAQPYQAAVGNTTVSDTASGYQVHASYDAAANAANPIDQNIVQYAIAVPAAGLSLPNGATWNTVATSARTANSDAASVRIDEKLDDDECLWVRVNTKYINKTTEGPAKLVKVGMLKTPSISGVTRSESTHRATITVENPSTVPDAFVVVLYRTASAPDKYATVGIIPHGSTSTTVQCPDWSGETAIAFGIYAAVGSYKQQTREDGVSSYSVDAKMTSDGIVWAGGQVPNAPTNVVARPGRNAGSIYVTWDWTWTEADRAVISWADHDDAWASTDEPEDYTISNLHAGEWTIANVETGKTWYIRIKLVKGSGDDVTEGPWSDMAEIDLSSAPSVPLLQLSSGVITTSGNVSAIWSYVTTDGTSQAYAEICEASIGGGGITHGGVIAHTETAQNITLYAKGLGWAANSTHNLCVRVTSASGKPSEWSTPVSVKVAAPLQASIYATSLSSGKLTSMPMAVTIRGAGTGGTTTLAIERAEDYHVDRPDETDFNGFEGETIALYRQTGEATITIRRDDLIGSLDDGADYNIVATVQDGLGQSSTVRQRFTVAWAHQAVVPTATVVIDGTIAKITPIQPATGYATGDTVDIYRLSVDRPELVVAGASFGTTYVDPYPTIGEYGGYRVVYRTIDGDYITTDNVLAWTDYGAAEGVLLDLDTALINFGGDELAIAYNIGLSNKWEKDFKQTRYLGGSIQGDWNPGVLRTGGVEAVTVMSDDPAVMKGIRSLAEYADICHIRTPDGSSYACDIQVSDSLGHDTAGKINSFQLTITKVDPEDYDGMTLAAWEEGDQ